MPVSGVLSVMASATGLGLGCRVRGQRHRKSERPCEGDLPWPYGSQRQVAGHSTQPQVMTGIQDCT